MCVSETRIILEHLFSLLTAVPCWHHFRLAFFLSLHLSDTLLAHVSDLHWHSDLIQYLIIVPLPKMFEQVTDLIEHVFRLRGGRGTCISLFVMLLFLSHLSLTFLHLFSPSLALVSTYLGTHGFIQREEHSNSLLSTSRNNMRFVPQNMISKSSAECWPVSFFRSWAAFCEV